MGTLKHRCGVGASKVSVLQCWELWDCPSKLEWVKGWSSLDTQKLLAACDGGKVTLPQQMC